MQVVGGSEGEVRALLRLSIPIVIAQLGQMMLGVVDAAFAGRLSVHALDAVTLAMVWVGGTMYPLCGLVWGVGALMSQAHGAGRGDEVGLALQRALFLALALAGVLALCWTYTDVALRVLGQEPEHIDTAAAYARTLRFGAPGFLLYCALTTYLNSRSIVRPAIITMLLANVFNAFLNWVLIFGHLGFAPRGVLGSAIATGVTDLLLPVVLGLIIVRYDLYRGAWVPWSRRVFDRAAYALQLRLGVPSAVTLGLELWCFQLGTVLAGRLGPVELGAHAITLSLASLSFMVPLGLSIGAAARVGQLIGAGESERAQAAAHATLKLIAGFALCSCCTFVVGQRALPRLYSADPQIGAMAASVLPIAAAFQLFDGLQAGGSGILRGMGRPRITATVNLLGYFVFGIPLAYFLGLHTSLRLSGIWLGYAAGLAFVASALVGTVLWRGPRTVKPLVETPLSRAA